jgi:polyribonucleotide nucleotidyltransferase
LADFGAFVEIIPGTEGLLHISEVAEHRIKDVRDELKEGDQVLVKVLAVEGNRIRLSRKAILKEQRAKMGGAPPPDENGAGEERAPVEAVAVAAPVTGGLTLEGGAEFEEGDEPNFNRVDAPQPSSAGDRGGDRPRGGGGRPGGGGGGGGRRRGRRDGGRGGRGGHSGGGHGGGGGRH